MVKRIAVLGAGGHGHDLRAWIDAAPGLVFDGWFDDKDGQANIADHVGTDYVLGVWDPRDRRRLDKGGGATVIHPTAMVAHHSHLADGVCVGPGAIIDTGCRIGRHTHIGAGAVLVRTHIGQWCSVGIAASIEGDVQVGDCVQIGGGARIGHLSVLGDGCIIGTGAIIPPRTIVPVGTTWVSCKAHEASRRPEPAWTDPSLDYEVRHR